MRNQPEYRLHYDADRFLPDHRVDVERIVSRCVVSDSGCWEWQGARKGPGYGNIWSKRTGRLGMTHRLMLEATGADLVGKSACHACDNPPCCNPNHLFAGTARDNAQDAKSKGRASLPPRTDWPQMMRRRRHHWQKLDRAAIPDIRRRLAAGEKQKDIARDYGVTFQAISKIKLGDRWGHVDA